MKDLTYGTSQSPADRSNGKLKTAVRHNWIVPPGGTTETDATVTETYVYGGRGGRVSTRTMFDCGRPSGLPSSRGV